MRSAGFAQQRLVLGERARIERPHQARGLDQPLRPRGGAIGEQPRRHARQEQEVIVRLRRALERDPQQRAQAARERRREYGVALDHTRVAEARLFARSAPVHQRDGKPAFPQMQRDRDADDPSTEHQCVLARHVLPFPPAMALADSAPLRATEALPQRYGRFIRIARSIWARSREFSRRWPGSAARALARSP